MKNLFLLLATSLSGFCSVAAAQTPPPSDISASAPKPHPILGNWRWTLPGKQCTETLQYRDDGSRLGASGEEVTKATYSLPALPGLLGFYKLQEITTESNAKSDCAGDTHEASDEASTRYVQFSPKLDQLIICKTESLQACYGPLKRVAE